MAKDFDTRLAEEIRDAKEEDLPTLTEDGRFTEASVSGWLGRRRG